MRQPLFNGGAPRRVSPTLGTLQTGPKNKIFLEDSKGMKYSIKKLNSKLSKSSGDRYKLGGNLAKG
jgi:hypothetical protein